MICKLSNQSAIQQSIYRQIILILIFNVYRGDHVEVVSLDYDPTKIVYAELLDLFWNNHEYGLTTRVKRQYMSLILYHNEEQKRIALNSIKEERVKRAPEVINTEISPAGPFYPAEE